MSSPLRQLLFCHLMVAGLLAVHANTLPSQELTSVPVTIDHVSSGKPYGLARAEVGAKTCIDRSFEIRELSDALASGLLLQTSNDDDFATAAEHVRLQLAVPGEIYICYDSRSHKAPAWLNGWQLTSEKMVTTDTTSRVYRKVFPAGMVTLGANERAATGGLSCYFAVIVPGKAAEDTPARPKIDVSFAKDIQPLLARRCYECHGADLAEGGLRLDVRRLAMLGGDSGAAVNPGFPNSSQLMHRIEHDDPDERMPADAEPLAAREIELLRAWIEQGAQWPDELAGKEDYLEHWSFRRITRPAVPQVKHTEQVRNPIDNFILARLEPVGMALSPEADPATLIRRLHLDLTGLPPTPREVADFTARIIQLQKDDKHSVFRIPQSAIEELVERLLNSPHFGERWGRHWLDLARFAESDGYENDRLRPDAWRYRDWVIDAVNRDLPFDRFTIEQLAGDLLPDATTAQLVATGFHRNTLWNSAASADKEEFRIRAVKDRAETTATAWLGLTLACAQCHSHKYDPIPQREYYQFYAFFNNADDQQVKVEGGEAMAMRQVSRQSHVHRRGNFLDHGPAVQPAAPAFLPPAAARGPQPDRLDLARWIVDRRNPLTARVAVNRYWQHLFGRPLAASPENFGRNGQPPSHGNLLDWLADELVANGWSRKHLIRTIVTSAAYRQSSRVRKELAARDPENQLLGRQNRFRVEAEIVRDAALSVSGLLNPEQGGPSIVPPFPEGLLSHQLTQEVLKPPGGDRHRRSVYIHVQRTLTHPSLAVFDVADGNSVSVRRERSITPVQALALLNDPVFSECAVVLGERLLKGAQVTDERLRLAFQLCLAREPAEEEMAVLHQLVKRQQEAGTDEVALWHGVARTMLNLDEFITRE